MRRSLTLAVLSLFGLSIWVAAQQSTPPDIITSQTNAAIALQGYKSWAEGQIASLWTTVNGSVTQAQLTALQTQVTGLAQQVSSLQAQVTALSTPAPTATTLSFTGLPNGPLNGIYQGVNFGTGFWTVISGQLAPAADGMPSRSFVFSKPVTITSFTFTSVQTRTTGLLLINATGQQAIGTAAATNQPTSFSPGWTSPTISFTVSAQPATGTADAMDLRIIGIVYQ